jgi:hypothetical protein
MNAPRWTLKYVAGAGTILHKPLSDGQCEFFLNQPFTVSNFDDYRRLVYSGRGDFEDITPVEDPVEDAVAYPVTRPVAEPTVELDKSKDVK